MVSKIIGAIATTALIITLCVGGVCAAYDAGSTAVREGLESISGEIDRFLGGTGIPLTMDQVSAGTHQAASGMAGLVGTIVDSTYGTLFNDTGMTSDEASEWVEDLSMLAGGSPADPRLSSTADGRAYLAWREAVASPLNRVLESSGVSIPMLQGVAAGTVAPSAFLASVTDATLVSVESNAANYSLTVGNALIPQSLPPVAREAMTDGSAKALQVASLCQELMEDTRALQKGDLIKGLQLPGTAESLVYAIRDLDSLMSLAEKTILGQ